MRADPHFDELAARIGAFHITDRAMKRAQRAVEAALKAGVVDERLKLSYLREAKRYFAAFESEARSGLRDVDRRLEQLNQVRFNLTAERGVALKRIEGTSSILQTLASMDRGTQ